MAQTEAHISSRVSRWWRLSILKILSGRSGSRNRWVIYVSCMNVLIVQLVRRGNGLTTLQHCYTPQETCRHHIQRQRTGFKSINNLAREISQYDRLDYESTWPRILFIVEGWGPPQGLQWCVRQTESIFESKFNGGVYLFKFSLTIAYLF